MVRNEANERRRARRVPFGALACCLAACAPEPTPRPCDALMTGGAGPRDAEALAAILQTMRPPLFPELEGVTVDLAEGEREASYFWAQFDYASVEAEPRDRRYLVFHDRDLFVDPPSHDAVVAVLAHELGHLVDYTGMSAEELGRFVYWYVNGDVAEYERETDLHVLELGCGPGLIEFRRWLYAHIDESVLEEKLRSYFTPEEIEAWMEANP